MTNNINGSNPEYYKRVGITDTTARYLACYMNGDSGPWYVYIYAYALFKQDNWQELCTIAGLNSSDYASEVNLCATSNAITTILNNKEAVDFMIYQCTGSFLCAFICSTTAKTALASSSYKTKIYANEHWNKFLAMVA